MEMDNKKINKTLFLCVIFLQIGFVLSIPVIKEASIRSGKAIVVKTIPVDPQSLFRGDYINLNYEFSRIDLNKVKHDESYFDKGQRVFVKLSKEGGPWEAAQVSSKPLKNIGLGEVMVVGSISNWPSQNSIHVIYGVESYFVPEGEGKHIEKKIVDKRATVELSIDKKGFASVRKIFVDDKEVKFR